MREQDKTIFLLSKTAKETKPLKEAPPLVDENVSEEDSLSSVFQNVKFIDGGASEDSLAQKEQPQQTDSKQDAGLAQKDQLLQTDGDKDLLAADNVFELLEMMSSLKSRLTNFQEKSVKADGEKEASCTKSVQISVAEGAEEDKATSPPATPKVVTIFEQPSGNWSGDESSEESQVCVVVKEVQEVSTQMSPERVCANLETSKSAASKTMVRSLIHLSIVDDKLSYETKFTEGLNPNMGVIEFTSDQPDEPQKEEVSLPRLYSLEDQGRHHHHHHHGDGIDLQGSDTSVDVSDYSTPSASPQLVNSESQNGDSLSEGEIQQKCLASIGEIHQTCTCKTKDAKGLRQNPLVLVQSGTGSRHSRIYRQTTNPYNANVASYYVRYGSPGEWDSSESAGLVRK